MEEQEKQGYVNVPERILDNVSLETIKVLEILSKQASVKPRNQNGIPIKYDKSRSVDDNSLKPYEEFLVYIRIYEPFKSQPRSLKYRTSIPVLKLKSVISILGSQTLYELRQKIMCQSDLSITKEISENPNQRPESMAKVIIFSILNYIYFITIHVFVID